MAAKIPTDQIVTSRFASCLQEKVIKLDECMEGTDPEAVLLLLTYMYAPDTITFISSMEVGQLEKAAALADVWAMRPLPGAL